MTAACPNGERAGSPLVLLSYFELRDVPMLLQAVRKARLPQDTRVFMGTYGAQTEVDRAIHGIPGGRYARMFDWRRTPLWERRRLAKGERKRLGIQKDPYQGSIPDLDALYRMPASDRLQWGLELGRRMRDAIRADRRGGVRIDTWQFDEVLGEAGGPDGRPVRELTRAVLYGLSNGRKKLDRDVLKGFVWFSQTSLRLADRPLDEESVRFWNAVDHAGLAVVGEEYPHFEGKPEHAALRHALRQVQLLEAGGVRKRIGQKYVVGLTPGYRLVNGKGEPSGLGGNRSGLSREEVNAWRTAYILARARQDVAGFAEFFFRFENASPRVMQDTLQAVADGASLAGCRQK